MNTEFEISFIKIDKNDLRKKIKSLWWTIIQNNYLMKRIVFHNPILKKSYLRVRDEGNRITCTYKEISDWNLDISSVKELETIVGDFDATVSIFKKLWLKQKAYQESYRETWTINNEVFFMIDEWPWLKPFLEIEWISENIVKEYTKKLWFEYNEWLFWAVDEIYFKELSLPRDYINNLEVITFENIPKALKKAIC